MRQHSPIILLCAVITTLAMTGCLAVRQPEEGPSQESAAEEEQVGEAEQAIKAYSAFYLVEQHATLSMTPFSGLSSTINDLVGVNVHGAGAGTYTGGTTMCVTWTGVAWPDPPATETATIYVRTMQIGDTTIIPNSPHVGCLGGCTNGAFGVDVDGNGNPNGIFVTLDKQAALAETPMRMWFDWPTPNTPTNGGNIRFTVDFELLTYGSLSIDVPCAAAKTNATPKAGALHRTYSADGNWITGANILQILTGATVPAEIAVSDQKNSYYPYLLGGKGTFTYTVFGEP